MARRPLDGFRSDHAAFADRRGAGRTAWRHAALIESIKRWPHDFREAAQLVNLTPYKSGPRFMPQKNAGDSDTAILSDDELNRAAEHGKRKG